MHYESSQWDLKNGTCKIHGMLKIGTKSPHPFCVACIDERHPDLQGVYPVQLSEDSPQKTAMVLESFFVITKQKLERKKLWRAFVYWAELRDHIESCHFGGKTEKQCVRAIRKAFEKCDEIVLELTKSGLDRGSLWRGFSDILYGVLHGFEVADIMENVTCNQRSKGL